MIFGYFVLGLIVVIVLASIKQVNQYEKGVNSDLENMLR